MFQHVVDQYPAVNKPLSAKYVKSFAHPTFKERIPSILQKLIDYLKDTEEIKKNHGNEALTEVGNLITKIENLKISMQSDRPLDAIHANGVFKNEVSIYNRILQIKTMENNGNPPTWFETEWLFAECYLYFKLFEIFHVCRPFENFDPFLKSKVDTFLASKNAISFLSQYWQHLWERGVLSAELRKDYFIFFLKCALWGNQADLSLSEGEAVAINCSIMEDMESMDPHILANDADRAYEILKVKNCVIDIVLDNAGYELFNDLVFADYMITIGLASKIIFHGKAIPWFVSDVTPTDFDMQFELLGREIKSEHARLNKERWVDYIKTGKWVMKAETFWVLPYDYSQMERVDPELYAELGKSTMVIFKGDLNYRKLMGDIYWEPTTSFRAALRGFLPTNVLALRTIKADTVSGLPQGLFEKLTKTEPNWMITGKYALVQLLEKQPKSADILPEINAATDV